MASHVDLALYAVSHCLLILSPGSIIKFQTALEMITEHESKLKNTTLIQV